MSWESMRRREFSDGDFEGSASYPMLYLDTYTSPVKKALWCFRTRVYGELRSGGCPKENLEVSYVFVVLRCVFLEDSGPTQDYVCS